MKQSGWNIAASACLLISTHFFRSSSVPVRMITCRGNYCLDNHAKRNGPDQSTLRATVCSNTLKRRTHSTLSDTVCCNTVRHRVLSTSVRRLCPGRGLRSVVLDIAGRQLMVATSHLESVVPPSFNSAQRQQQLHTSVTAMEGTRHANLVLAGVTQGTHLLHRLSCLQAC